MTSRNDTPADRIRTTIERYVKHMNAGDADAIAGLYAEACSVEDPVGATPIAGHAAVHEFYRKSAGHVRLELSGPVRVSGHEAAFPMVGTLGSADDPSYLDVIDVMTFDDEGRITSMRAFWSPDGIRKG